MEIHEGHEGNVTIITLKGSIDGQTAPMITEHIQQSINQGSIRLVADFTGVEYTSSAGLRVLLSAIKDTRSSGGDLRLAGVQKDVLKVLNLSGFTNIIKIFPDAASAIASFA